MIGWLIGGTVAVAGGYLLTRKRGSKSYGSVSEEGVITLSDGSQVLWRVVRTSKGFQGLYSPPIVPGFDRQWIRATPPDVPKATAKAAAIQFAKALDPASSEIVASDEIAEGRWRVRRLPAGSYQGEYLRTGSSSWAIALPAMDSPDKARLLALEALAYRPNVGTSTPPQTFTPEQVAAHLIEILQREGDTVTTYAEVLERARVDPNFAQIAPCIMASQSAADLQACGIF